MSELSCHPVRLSLQWARAGRPWAGPRPRQVRRLRLARLQWQLLAAVPIRPAAGRQHLPALSFQGACHQSWLPPLFTALQAR